VFSTPSVSRSYKRDKVGAAVSQSAKRRVEGWCEMAASVGVTQLWDFRQPVRMLAEGIVRIRYQETTSGETDFVLQLQ
jgi:hypothetical protein